MSLFDKITDWFLKHEDSEDLCKYGAEDDDFYWGCVFIGLIIFWVVAGGYCLLKFG